MPSLCTFSVDRILLPLSLQCGAAALTELQTKLQAAEAGSSSCTAEAASLKGKLQQAEASLASNSAALKDLETQLAAAPKAGEIEAEKAQLQAAAQAAKDSLAAAERQLSEASGQVQATMAQLERSQGEVAALKSAVEAAKAQAAAAQGQADSCTSQHTTCQGSLQTAANDAAAKLKAAQNSQQGVSAELAGLKDELTRVRAEAAAAKAALSQVEEAWLPRWAEQAGRSAAASVGPALEQAKQYAAQGSKQAQEAWVSHGKPALAQGVTLAKGKAAQLNSFIEAKAGDSWPKAQAAIAHAAQVACTQASAAAAAAHKAALAAWNSEALAAVRPALAKGYAVASQQAQTVVGELETLLISLLSKNNNTVALARRPYVTYMVYSAFLVPLVAFGLPLLGLRRAPKPQVGDNGRPTGAPMSTKKKKKPASKL